MCEGKDILKIAVEFAGCHVCDRRLRRIGAEATRPKYKEIVELGTRHKDEADVVLPNLDQHEVPDGVAQEKRRFAVCGALESLDAERGHAVDCARSADQ